MAPKTNRRKKPNSKDDGDATVVDMLGRMTLDEQTIRSTLHAAKKGSAPHISIISKLMPKLPANYAADAVTTLCTVLDVPAFPPEQPLPASLTSTRPLVLEFLLGLAKIPVSVLLDEQYPSLGVLERNWSTICNWMQYFFHDFTTSQDTKSSSSMEDQSPTPVMTSISTIIYNIFSSDDEVFKRLTIKDDSLINLLVKVWFSPKVSPSDPLSVSQCYGLVHSSFTILDEHDPSWMRLAQVVRDLILREAQGDTGVVTKKLVQQIRNPAKACRECFQLVAFSLQIIIYFIDERLGEHVASKFMDNLLKEGLVPLTSQLLSFVSQDLTNPLERRALSDTASSDLIELSLRLLLKIIDSRNGPHWVALLFKLGFLHSVTRILSSIRCLKDVNTKIPTAMFEDTIPLYLCRRLVIASAIKAVKEITVNGNIAILEASTLQEPWLKITNILLDRTVFNTVYERDFAVIDVRMCENCKKPKQDASLFKCAGCKTTRYCSRECQTTAWKTGGHRSHCKEMQKVWSCTQMGMEIDMSIYFLALAELRRHTPGVSQHLASAKNPSGIPLQDAYFTISFMTFPPTITVRSGEPVLDLPDDHPENKSRAIFRECQRSVGDRGDGLPAAYEVSSFLGGRRPTLLHHVFPSKIQLWAQGKKFDGDAEVDNVYRKPAKDDKGNNLAFVLDEIDRYVMDARKNFRPPAPGDEASPKTIYDYIEAKVTVDRDAMAWLGFKFYH